ncbi:MAG: phosphoglucosamine mutase [Proteobacteria bacterium]|nr:phosphoglucosamine mutase [Pseudomonadota bacterium]
MSRLFGTDGVRGLANVYPMSPDMILRLGQAIGIYFSRKQHHPKILIGKDTRRSGYMLEQALCSGICSVGVDAFFLGPLPTPGIAYLTRGLRASAGIVISASHNPYHDNGIKIFSSDGYKLPDEVEDELESLVQDPNLADQSPTGADIGTAKRIDDAVGQYAVFLKEQFPKHLKLDGLRIVLDCAHGAGYKVGPKVFQELGAEVFVIGNEPNGTNINERCGALYPHDLREKVLLYKADLGIGLDGDADRIVLIDEKGEIIDGDEILAVCGISMLKKGNLHGNTLVATVMSNMGLEAALAKHGGKLIRAKVGDRYVMDSMRQGDFTLGGEQSGHLIFRDSSTTGDGILAGLKFLEIMIEENKTASELRHVMERFPQLIRNIKVKEKIPLEQLTTFNQALMNVEKTLNGRGRVVFRYSGTESLARIMIEGNQLEEIEKFANSLSQELVLAIENNVKRS